jgi:hypothetical protein
LLSINTFNSRINFRLVFFSFCFSIVIYSPISSTTKSKKTKTKNEQKTNDDNTSLISSKVSLEDQLKLAEELIKLENQEKKQTRILSIGTFVDPEAEKQAAKDREYNDCMEWLAFLNKMSAYLKSKSLHDTKDQPISTTHKIDPSHTSSSPSSTSSPSTNNNRKHKRQEQPSQNQNVFSQGKEHHLMKLLKITNLDQLSNTKFLDLIHQEDDN